MTRIRTTTYLLTLLLLAATSRTRLPAQKRVSIRPHLEQSSQALSDAATQRSTIKVDAPLVVLNVTVTDPMNRLVTGLRRQNFTITEDRVPQQITHFGAQDTPVSVGLVVDASGSMGYKMAKTREAVAEFFKQSHRKDEYLLVEFNNRPRMITEFTRDTADLQNELIYTESKGRTSLIDAVYLAVSRMRQASNPRKAVLIISDGGDNSSRYTERELRRLVKEADVQIYAIGLFEPVGSRATLEEVAGPDLLTRITAISGGQQFPVTDLNDLPDVVENIGLALRNQYQIGYIPMNQEKDGKWRRLRVKLEQVRGLGRLHPYFRLGYYAPTR